MVLPFDLFVAVKRCFWGVDEYGVVLSRHAGDVLGCSKHDDNDVTEDDDDNDDDECVRRVTAVWGQWQHVPVIAPPIIYTIPRHQGYCDSVTAISVHIELKSSSYFYSYRGMLLK